MSNKKININRFKITIMLLASMTILLISAYFTYTSYQKNISNFKDVEQSKLKAIVSTLAADIDGDIHEKLIRNYKEKDAISKNNQDSNYLEIQTLLLKTRERNNLNSDLYTLVIDERQPKNSFFGVSSSNPYFRHNYVPPNKTVANLDKAFTLDPYKDDHGTWISAFAPIRNNKKMVVAIVQADIHFDEFIEKAQKKAINELITISGIIIAVISLILILLNSMLNRLRNQQTELFSEFEKLDELSSYIREFLNRILTGNFKNEGEEDSFSDKSNPVYKSLIETEQKVAESTKKEHEQQWVLEGESKLSTILQQNENVEDLANAAIKYIVEYSKAAQGSVYVFDEGDELLKMISRYAYNRQKYKFEDFKIGEGLVGQCGFEKDTIYRTEMPEDYFTITSGLKEDKKPSSVILVPLLNNKDLLGVVEIASEYEMSESTITFIETAVKNTSQILFNIQTNVKTKQFLDEALAMSKELKEQKLVLEQNAKEMKATQEEIIKTNAKLEEQVQEVENQQNKLNALLSQSAEIISIYDPMMNVIYKSPSVEHILGYKPEELIGKNDFKIRGNEGLTAIMGMFEKLMDFPDDSQIIEYESVTKSGESIWLEAKGQNMLENPAIKGIVISTRDITERRAAEKEQEMRAKMQALSENSQDIIIRFDLEGNFLYVNSRLRHYTGIFTSFSGKNFKEVGINPDIVRRWDKVIRDMQKEPKLIQREMFFETEIDDYIMQINAIPEFDKDDQLETVLIVSHDITARKKQEIEIQETNQKITESINYAKRIQNAIIPMEEEIKKQFNDFLMFYMPKDVVSGDFPWYYKKDDYIYIAAVDCTGHGVPGAMMSLIGYLLLNDIVNDDEHLEPGEVLLRLHRAVVSTLKQDAEDNNTSDGMDVALCRISLTSNEVLYAGAHRPLYLVRNNEVEQFKGSPFPIGGMQYRGRNKYKTRGFEYQEGDSIYFFSDGLPDQFGENGEDKYSPQRIRELIVEYKNKTMKEQEQIFKQDLIEWMGKEKQIDDVLLMGIKF